MRTITMIEVIPGGTLYVDLLKDPLKVVIRRRDAGRVQVEVGELSHLTAVLADVSTDLMADEERFVRIDNSNDTLFVDSTLWEPPAVPAVVVWRMSGGLVRIEAGELQRLIEALVLAGKELAALAGWVLNEEGLCECGHGQEWHLMGWCAYVVEKDTLCSCMEFRPQSGEGSNG